MMHRKTLSIKLSHLTDLPLGRVTTDFSVEKCMMNVHDDMLFRLGGSEVHCDGDR